MAAGSFAFAPRRLAAGASFFAAFLATAGVVVVGFGRVLLDPTTAAPVAGRVGARQTRGVAMLSRRCAMQKSARVVLDTGSRERATGRDVGEEEEEQESTSVFLEEVEREYWNRGEALVHLYSASRGGGPLD